MTATSDTPLLFSAGRAADQNGSSYCDAKPCGTHRSQPDSVEQHSQVSDVVERVPKLERVAAYVGQEMRDRLIAHREYIDRWGEDMPEIRGWDWIQR